ncbi:hypothetical protein C0993_000250, partial [Termitomyces sp. T159_Od127]
CRKSPDNVCIRWWSCREEPHAMFANRRPWGPVWLVWLAFGELGGYIDYYGVIKLCLWLCM